LYHREIGTFHHLTSRSAPVSVMVKSEITGKIWKVEANVGQSVSQDDQIIVIESMKMEIPVLAPTTGVVREIRVAEGEDVKEGQVVAVIG
jgi:acetyl-CoA carboxylase biotin carboxyl carrier protein